MELFRPFVSTVLGLIPSLDTGGCVISSASSVSIPWVGFMKQYLCVQLACSPFTLRVGTLTENVQGEVTKLRGNNADQSLLMAFFWHVFGKKIIIIIIFGLS